MQLLLADMNAVKTIGFQSPDGEFGNAVLSLGFRMEYRMHCAFFQTWIVLLFFFLPGFNF